MKSRVDRVETYCEEDDLITYLYRRSVRVTSVGELVEFNSFTDWDQGQRVFCDLRQIRGPNC